MQTVRCRVYSYGAANKILTTVVEVVTVKVRHLGVRDVLVRRQEQYHLSLLILDGYDVQQAPERRA